MIVDKINNMDLYKGLGAGLEEGLRFIAVVNKDILIGTYEIGNNTKAIVSQYQTKVLDDAIFEAHRKVIDIQCIIEGKELVRWAPLSSLSLISDYNPQKDISLHSASGESASFLLTEGLFAIFFPEDAHNPGLALGKNQGYVKKVVVKVGI
jgi:biofilm protein TabA